MFVASDVAALVRYTHQVVHLDDGEIAIVGPTDSAPTLDARRDHQDQPPSVDVDARGLRRGRLRALHAQGDPRAARSGRRDAARPAGHPIRHRAPRRPQPVRPRAPGRSAGCKMLGCGSAYYAGVVGRPAHRGAGPDPGRAEPASEFRYRNPVIEPDTLYIGGQPVRARPTTRSPRSQEIKRKGGRVLGVVNSVGQHHRPRVRRRHLPARRARRSRSPRPRPSPATAVVFALLALHLGPDPRPRRRPTAAPDRRAARAARSRSREVLASEEHIAQLAELAGPAPAAPSSSGGSAAIRSPWRAPRS